MHMIRHNDLAYIRSIYFNYNAVKCHVHVFQYTRTMGNCSLNDTANDTLNKRSEKVTFRKPTVE